jgi:hypothetical protein
MPTEATMRNLLHIILHGFIGGAAVAISTIPTSTPFTAHNILLPILASAGSSILSLLVQSPLQNK